jgi:hypothetical protein
VLAEGGELPELRNEAFAELVLSPNHIVNGADQEYWSRETAYWLLDSGVSVYAAVSFNNVPEPLLARTHTRRHEGRGYLRFIEIVLNHPLRMTLAAGQQGRLQACECTIPALDAYAGSLNEAYSKIVTRFEPNRRSNTGNVFSKIFVEDGDQLVKLDNLRAQIINELFPSGN